MDNWKYTASIDEESVTVTFLSFYDQAGLKYKSHTMDCLPQKRPWRSLCRGLGAKEKAMPYSWQSKNLSGSRLVRGEASCEIFVLVRTTRRYGE